MASFSAPAPSLPERWKLRWKSHRTAETETNAGWWFSFSLILSLERQPDYSLELGAYWRPNTVLQTVKGFWKKRRFSPFPEKLGSKEMICILSSKCKLGIYMINYREIWLPETETQLEVLMRGMCLEQAFKRMESRKEWKGLSGRSLPLCTAGSQNGWMMCKRTDVGLFVFKILAWYWPTYPLKLRGAERKRVIIVVRGSRKVQREEPKEESIGFVSERKLFRLSNSSGRQGSL